MKYRLSIFFILIYLLIFSNISAQSYDFSAITQMLNDSSSLYLNRIYVEVFKNNSSIYKYQTGFLQCNNLRPKQTMNQKFNLTRQIISLEFISSGLHMLLINTSIKHSD